MKRQKLNRKLVLNKETIRELTDGEALLVAGGGSATFLNICPVCPASEGNGCGTQTCNTCFMTYPCCTSRPIGTCQIED